MINRWKIPICVWALILLGHQSNAGEAVDRIAEYLAHQSQVESCMSVLIYRAAMEEFTDASLDERISLTDVIQRLIICKDTNEERFDAMQKSVDGSVSKEAQVIAGGECLYWTSVQPLMEIRRIEMKNGRPMRGTRSRRLNPFALPVSTSSIVMTELTDLNVFHGKLQVIEEFELKDGRYRVYIVGNDWGDKGACEVTFAKEPQWAPVEFKMYFRMSAPKPSGKLSGDIIRNWKLLYSTTTQWQQIDYESDWLPSSVIMESDDVFIDHIEFTLTDWKLGKKVDRSPLQKSEFTPEKIPQQIDFDSVAIAFEKIRAKRNK